MSYKPEPAIWSRDTGQRIACCDSCQLTIAWTPKIKDVAIVMVLLLVFKVLGTLRYKDGRNEDGCRK